MKNPRPTVKRTPPTPEQIHAEQNRQAEADHAAKKAALPAKPTVTAVVPPDNRTNVQKYLDDIAPASIVGRMVKFTKEGRFETTDDEAEIADDVEFIALADQTLVGWICGTMIGWSVRVPARTRSSA